MTKRFLILLLVLVLLLLAPGCKGGHGRPVGQDMKDGIDAHNKALSDPRLRSVRSVIGQENRAVHATPDWRYNGAAEASERAQ